jgi:hypothetical protein
MSRYDDGPRWRGPFRQPVPVRVSLGTILAPQRADPDFKHLSPIAAERDRQERERRADEVRTVLLVGYVTSGYRTCVTDVSEGAA